MLGFPSFLSWDKDVFFVILSTGTLPNFTVDATNSVFGEQL